MNQHSLSKWLLWPVLLILFHTQLAAQSASKFTISGTIVEGGSSETLPGVVVMDTTTKSGTVTNAFGFYSLTLPEGKHVIAFNFVGFVTQWREVDLHSDVALNIELSNNATTAEVEIVAEKQERISEESRMSTVAVPIEQIKEIPALLGEKDVLKVIQLLPGVQKGSEGSSGIYVRGGGPDQNLIMLDDATVYNANHLFGFFSLFNGDALKSVELTKGGFPARYGGRLSSVLEMRMKDGNKEEWKGEAGIGLISSRLTLEGPVKKGKSSLLVSGRRTYIDLLAQPLILAATNGEALGGYFFYDFNAKYNHIIDDKNRLYVSGYFGKDKFYVRERYDGDLFKANFNWGNATATARWNHIHSPRVFSNTSLIFTNFAFTIFSEENFDEDFYSLKYQSGIRDLSVKYDLDFIPNPNHYIRAGALVTRHLFRPSVVVTKSSFGDNETNKADIIPSLETAVYVEDDWGVTDKIKINYGLRISQYLAQQKNYVKPEPRISARWILAKDLSAKASYALMNQYVHLLSNTGVGLPTDLWVPATAQVGPQQSQQWAAGFAKDLPKHDLFVSLEGYYKTMDGVISYREGASFLELEGDENTDPLAWQNNITQGRGKSYGAEFLVQKKRGRWTGWIGYTLSWTKLQFDELNFGREFWARYDRRHDISVVSIYKINDHITLSATWVYGTGQAITLPLATFSAPTNIGMFLGEDFNMTNSAQDYGEKNSFRMAPYHRLDIAAQFRKEKKRSERTFEVGLYNAYSRQNPFYYYIESDYNESSITNKLK